MLRLTQIWTAALVTTGVALTALAAGSAVDASKSSIVATFKQEGVPVDSPFKKFSGEIAYDPKNVAAATASIDVDMTSMDIGDEAYNEEVRKKQWFDSATYPKATFRSTSIKPGAAGHFDATGTLTFKGKAVTITVPITVSSVAGGTAFDGTLNLSRKTLNVGDPVWNDILEDAVKVKFRLVSR